MTKPPRITWRGSAIRAIKSRHMRKYLADKNTRLTQNLKAIALARQQIVEYILMVQKQHDLSLRKAVIHFEERARKRNIAPHIIEAVITAHGRPAQLASITVSRSTLFRWIRIYNRAGKRVEALEPLPSKTIYANDNNPNQKGPTNEQ